MKRNRLIISIVFMVLGIVCTAQQNPQYTQYMYNTQIINPAYSGSREALSFGLLGRTQWVSLEGSPESGTFTVNSPIGLYDNMGLGLSIVHDRIGPSSESNITADYAYRIDVSREGRLSFGLKAGVDVLNVDYSALTIFDQNDPFFQNNIDNRLQPQVGVGLYFNTDRFYMGASIPNFLRAEHFDEGTLEGDNVDSDSIALERLHYFLIAGYVFDLNQNLKFKPATLFKAVGGSPLQWDFSANFLFNEKFTLGASYRWSASLSALAGFQITDSLFLGMAYDYQTTEIESYSDGSYEVFLRFDIFKKSDRILTPRFF
ncbi:type IX secretion system membrane protein PorP/SprF [Flagellimonas sp. HMM57]|uniref:PorP/SprF family type IX secretion system membrane protein n=1 Tax=unclassified Flagellimonas TaxID=2644544 RepID=UPI0013D1AD6E|nr:MULTISPECIES: type IX secretion system membrane protein PorP/SprF [unclassified Flagellimonas]UII75985.1 type IX secretion system membrane protein PorP/SprF [Flagellimonas sp. HMM57]